MARAFCHLRRDSNVTYVATQVALVFDLVLVLPGEPVNGDSTVATRFTGDTMNLVGHRHGE
jgi:hypothetical protein